MISILFAAAITENVVLMRFLGLCPFLGVSGKKRGALGMGGAVTLVMLLATAVSFPLARLVLVPLELMYLETVLFILIIASLVGATEILVRRFVPALHKALGIYLPLITTNCAVLAVTLENAGKSEYNYGMALLGAVGSGLGFTLALWLMAGLRERIIEKAVPAPFRGLPIALLCAVFLSLAFAGVS